MAYIIKMTINWYISLNFVIMAILIIAPSILVFNDISQTWFKTLSKMTPKQKSNANFMQKQLNLALVYYNIK